MNNLKEFAEGAAALLRSNPGPGAGKPQPSARGEEEMITLLPGGDGIAAAGFNRGGGDLAWQRLGKKLNDSPPPMIKEWEDTVIRAFPTFPIEGAGEKGDEEEMVGGKRGRGELGETAGEGRGNTKRLELELTAGAKGVDDAILDLMSQQIDNKEKIDKNNLRIGEVEERLRARIETLEGAYRKLMEENGKLREGIGREGRKETFLEDRRRLVLYGFGRLSGYNNLHPMALCARDILGVIGEGEEYGRMEQEELIDELRGLLGKELCFVRRMGKEERAPILVEYSTQYGADEGLRRLRIRWGRLNREVRRAAGNREGLGFSQFHNSQLRNRVIMLEGVGKAIKRAFGQREKGQEGVLSYEIVSARESPLLKLRMRVGGRSNVLHFFPALSKNYRSLRDIEEDSLGVGKQGIYGDFKKIGDRDLGMEVEEIKWIVDQIVRGAEQNEAVVRCNGIIPSVMDIVNRKRGGGWRRGGGGDWRRSSPEG